VTDENKKGKKEKKGYSTSTSDSNDLKNRESSLKAQIRE